MPKLLCIMLLAFACCCTSEIASADLGSDRSGTVTGMLRSLRDQIAELRLENRRLARAQQLIHSKPIQSSDRKESDEDEDDDNESDSNVEGTGASSCIYETCFECSLDVRCGWCHLDGLCMEGDGLGPFNAACGTTWHKGVCPSSCADYADCGSCLGDSECGWCGESCSCVEKANAHGPMFAACQLNWIQSDAALCPISGNCTDIALAAVQEQRLYMPANVSQENQCDLDYNEANDEWTCQAKQSKKKKSSK